MRLREVWHSGDASGSCRADISVKKHGIADMWLLWSYVAGIGRRTAGATLGRGISKHAPITALFGGVRHWPGYCAAARRYCSGVYRASVARCGDTGCAVTKTAFGAALSDAGKKGR